MTIEQTKRVITEMRNIAKEPVAVEKIRGTVYAYSSEIGCLRLFAKYNANGARPNSKFRVGYSENLTTWYFALDTTFTA